MADNLDNTITSNPADRLQTYHITLLNKKTGETFVVRSHYYSIEDCALEVKETLLDNYSLVSILQPDTKTTFNSKDIEEI